jgi:hypothetical protein
VAQSTALNLDEREREKKLHEKSVKKRMAFAERLEQLGRNWVGAGALTFVEQRQLSRER